MNDCGHCIIFWPSCSFFSFLLFSSKEAGHAAYVFSIYLVRGCIRGYRTEENPFEYVTSVLEVGMNSLLSKQLGRTQAFFADANEQHMLT